MAGSIGTVGDALGDALCESTIGLFKTEGHQRRRPRLGRPPRGRVASRPMRFIGTTRTASTPRSATCRLLSSSTPTGRLTPWPPSRRSRIQPPSGKSSAVHQAALEGSRNALAAIRIETEPAGLARI